MQGHYIIGVGNRVGFKVSSYDHSRPLIIDPVLSYSTYLGGSVEDFGFGIAVDSTDNAYVSGFTCSPDFPLANPLQSSYAGGCNYPYGDAFVAKLNAAGSALVYSTYLGGSGSDAATGIAVDSVGNAYVTGFTSSTNFPTVNPIQAGCYDCSGSNASAFVAKLNAAGSALVYSTYLGGSTFDAGMGIAVDSVGNAYVTGFTGSTNFPTVNPFQAGCNDCTEGSGSAFVAKLNVAGSALVYSTYLGGSTYDFGYGIAADSAGSAYVTGQTGSADFPTMNPLQARYGGGLYEAFVTKLNASGTALVYSTYLGGSSGDAGQSIAVDSSGNAYLTGYTYSTDFPTVNPFQAACDDCSLGNNSGDAFVSKLNPTGSALVYSTYLGGSNSDNGYGISIDSSGDAYVTGSTCSSDFPTVNPIQTNLASSCSFAYGGNAFVSKLDAAGSALDYSTYLGGSNYDLGSGIAIDSTGNAYVTGFTTSTDFPTVNPFQAAKKAYGGTGFVAKISSPSVVSLFPPSLTFGPQNVGTTSPEQTAILSNGGDAPLSISSVVASGDFAESDNCGSSLPAGGNCTIWVTFLPTATGTRSGSVTINDLATGSPQILSLSGTGGTTPIATVAPVSVNFANQAVGTASAPQTITLNNIGSTPLSIATVSASNGFSQTSYCGSSLGPGGSCTLSVTFIPTTAGSYSGVLSITDNSNGELGSTQTVGLTGTGFIIPPVAAPARAETTFTSPVSITLSATDVYGYALTLSIVSGPAHGSLSGLTSLNPSSASVTYTANAGFAGVDSFVYAAANPYANMSMATVNITVYGNPVPEISQPLVPSAVAPGSAGFTLNVNGAGFISGAVVNWQQGTVTTPLATNFISATQVTAQVPAPLVAMAGTATATVVNSPLGGGASNPAFLPVHSPTPSATFNLGPYPVTSDIELSIAVGDFNGDGKWDLVVTNLFENSVSVFIGNGDGTVQPPLNYPTGTMPESVAVGDFNGDGKMDLVVANYSSNDLTILLGVGDGTFTPGPTIACDDPFSVVVGDFNRDGKLDIAANNSGGKTVSVFLGNGDGTFSAPLLAGTGGYPQSLAVGDFNGDGNLDLVVANFCANDPTCPSFGTISILLGNGTGQFSLKSIISTGASASLPAVGDFNGDGKLDLAVPSQGDDALSIFLGNGDGTFGLPTVIPIGVSSVIAGDLNGDGKLDLAVVNIYAQTVSILLGVGDGTFTSSGVTGLSGGEPTALVAADFNGDGMLDLAVAKEYSLSMLMAAPMPVASPGLLPFGAIPVGTSSTLPVVLSNPASIPFSITSIGNPGIFSQTNNCGSSLAPGASCTIEVSFKPTLVLDYEGSLTITGNYNLGAGSVTLNVNFTGIGNANPVSSVSLGSLSFGSQFLCTTSPQQTVTLSNPGNSPFSITSISISNNFATLGNCGGGVSPGGSCTLNVTFTPTVTGSITEVLTIVDNLNGVAGSAQTVSLAGTGVAQPPVATPGNVRAKVGSPVSITLSATDAYDYELTFSIITGPARGTLSNLTPLSANSASVIYTANAGSTGSDSFVFAATDPFAYSGTAAVNISIAANPLPEISQPLVPSAVAPGSSGFTLTVNGAGFVSGAVVKWQHGATATPLATTFISSTEVTAAVPASLITAAGTVWVTVTNPPPGGGVSNTAFFPITGATTSVSLALASQAATGSYPDFVAVGDFNGDGKLDLAVANAAGNTVSILLGDGLGNFTLKATLPTGENPNGLAVADFNGDGKLDLAVISGDSATVAVMLGNGDGTFLPPSSTTATRYFPNFVAAGDFNGDGKMDLAISIYSGSVLILLGNGDGTFGPNPLYVPTAGFTYSLAVGDFNGDGKLDVAALNYSSVSILLGNGDGTFNPASTSPVVGSQAVSIAAADFNGDGKLDLAVGNGESPAMVSILLGNGDGTFQPMASFAASGYPESMAVADFNGDGNLDLAVVNGTGVVGVSILDGNGDGTFQAPVNYAAGSSPASLAVGDFNGDGRIDMAVTNVSGDTVSILLQSPVVAASPATLNFNSQPLGVTSPAQTITLSNNGSAPLSLNSISPTGPNAGDFAETNNCADSIAAGGNCTIYTTFTPTAVGSRAANLTINDTAPGSPQTMALSGTGTGPTASLSAPSINFGNQTLGSTSTAQVETVTNTGTANLTISTALISGANAGDFAKSADSCSGATVVPNATCTVSVTFTPGATGSRSAALTFTDNTNGVAGSTQTVSLSGTGTAPGASLSAPSLTFSNQLIHTTSPAQTETVTNTGTANLTLSTVTISGMLPADFAKNADTCSGATVAPNATCTISLTFTPTQTGTITGTLTITDNSGDVAGSIQKVSLTGMGINPVASLSPKSVSFNNQVIDTTSSTQTATITSSTTGASNLVISSIAITGANAGDFAETNNCPTSMPPGTKCTVYLTYTPTILGAETASLTVTDNAANSPQSIGLSGSGIAPAVLSPTSLSFGNQPEDTMSAAKTVTLTNSLSTALPISSVTTSGDFGQTNTCGASVPANGKCTISITYTPSIMGAETGTLTVIDAASNSKQTATLTGTGTAPVTLNPASATYSSQSVGTTSTAKVFTLTSSMNIPLTNLAISASGDFAVSSTTCGTTLASDGKCTISVVFKPKATGTRTGTLSVSDSAGNSPQTAALTGTGK